MTEKGVYVWENDVGRISEHISQLILVGDKHVDVEILLELYFLITQRMIVPVQHHNHRFSTELFEVSHHLEILLACNHHSPLSWISIHYVSLQVPVGISAGESMSVPHTEHL